MVAEILTLIRQRVSVMFCCLELAELMRTKYLPAQKSPFCIGVNGVACCGLNAVTIREDILWMLSVPILTGTESKRLIDTSRFVEASV